MKVVLVGEAWGRTEATMQHALVGPSGRELTLQLGISGLAPFMTILCRKCKRETPFKSAHCEFCQEHIWPNEFTLIDHWKRLRQDHQIAVTNVFNTQPPGNDLGNFFGTEVETEMTGWKASKKTGGSHLLREHFHHIKRLWTELSDLKPNLIVAMGNAACWAILDQTKITALRGTVALSERLGIKTLPMFHPAAILRQQPMRVSAIADLRKAKREAEFPEIRRPERYITILDPVYCSSKGVVGLDAGYEWFTRPAGAYAVDIETSRGQITMVGFARSNSDALVIPLRVSQKSILGSGDESPNYWPTPDMELNAWRLIIKGLNTSTPKIFQNGVYDLSYFIRMGVHVKNALHDTMLWHHSEFIELPKSLGFLGSIYCNDVAWKSMVRHESLKRDE